MNNNVILGGEESNENTITGELSSNNNLSGMFSQNAPVRGGMLHIKGDPGNGISSIEKTGTSGLVDTYTIHFTNGNSTTFTVTNGAKGDPGNPGSPGQPGVSPSVTINKVGKVTTLIITDALGPHEATILDGNDGSGDGDMKKSVYDTNNDGSVDNAKKVNNHTVESDVPANAKFTDTIPDTSNFITVNVNNLLNYYLKNETYSKQEVNTIVGNLQQFHYEVVNALPATGATNILYLVPKTASQTNNVYDEYVYSNGWEKIGDTQIDLTNYIQKDQNGDVYIPGALYIDNVKTIWYEEENNGN